MNEIYWHTLYVDYGASADGKIYSKRYHPNQNKNSKLKQLKPSIAGKGYLQFGIYYENKKIKKYVHHMVYECYNQKIENWSNLSSDGLTINHKNRNKTDNRLENLDIVTHRFNCQDGQQYHKKSNLPKSVYLNKSCLEKRYKNPYRVLIRIAGKLKNFGSFATIEEAYAKSKQVYKDLFNEDI